MTASPRLASRRRRAHGPGRTLACAAVYAAAVLLGRATRLDGTQLALIWPAAGVAFVWLAGSWGRPAALVLDAALLFAVTVAGNVLTGASGALACAFGAANTVQALIACWLFARLTANAGRLAALRELLALGAASVAAAAAGAMIGPLAIWATTDTAWPVLPVVWIVRNAVSTFVIAAVVLSWRGSRDTPRTRAELGEFALFGVLGLGVHGVVFGLTAGIPVAFLTLPLAVLAGLRFRTSLAALHGALCATVIVALTLLGRGPFAELPASSRVVLAQAFIAVAAFTTIALALHRDELRSLVARAQDRGHSLQDERDFTDAILRTADALVIVLDATGRIVRFNAACERASGRTGAEVLGREFWDVVLPAEIVGDVRANFARLAAGSFPFRNENDWIHHDGSRRRIAWSNTCLTDADGRVAFVVGTGVDVTEQRALEAEIEDKRAFLAAVFEHLSSRLMITDEHGRLQVFSGEARALYADPDAEIAVADWPERFGMRTAEGDRALSLDEVPLYRALHGERVGDEEVRAATANGERRLLVNAGPITDGAGRQRGAMLFAHDITEQRASEAAVREARDAALEASRMKSAFLANMSHEIRTPMNGVIGMTELLLDTALDEQQRGYAAHVRASGESLLAVINDILDFSKIEAGKLELDRVPMSIRDGVEQVCDLLAPQAHAKGLEVVVHFDDAVPALVEGDPVRLQQVLINLAGNAIKFTDTGEVAVTVGIDWGVDDLALVRFEVRDTGIGIAPEVLPTLFDSFAQADMGASRRFGGTGLGLAISRQLAKLMHGTLTAHSRPGHGSTFALTVPLRVVAQDADRAPSDALAGVRALVVDDNATNRTILHDRLRGWDMEVEDAPDAAGAMLALRAAADRGTPFALALVDGCMPGVDGLELIERIRADPRLRSTALLLLTSMGGVIAAAGRDGVHACLTKPVRQEELRRALAAILSAPDADPAPASARLAPAKLLSASQPVLLAEDNPVNQAVATQLLRKRGLRVEVAADGRQAVDLLERRAYAAVFMDCQMPELDGYAATAEIRRRHGASLPIIAMTANAMKGDREKCLAAGMDDYIAKPLRSAELDAVLARWFDTARTEAPPPDPGRSGAVAARVDPAVLDELGDADLAGEVVERFLEDAGARGDALAHAAAAGDHHAVHQLAHALKGSAASVGAVTLAAAAGELQQRTDGTAATDPAGLVADVRGLIAASREPLAEAVAVLGTGG